MAELITTEAEKEALSYLDWDDASLAAVARFMALKLKNLSADEEGWKKITAASLAVMLVSFCVEANATTLELEFSGHIHGVMPTGDWRVVVERIAPPLTPAAPDGEGGR